LFYFQTVIDAVYIMITDIVLFIIPKVLLFLFEDSAQARSKIKVLRNL